MKVAMVIGVIILLGSVFYVLFLRGGNDEHIYSPIPDERGINVIYGTPTPVK